MILCITPNPAVDRNLIMPGLRVSDVNRAMQTIVAAGGKGLNVARVIRTLGGAPLCMGFLGGHAGRLVAELAEREGLPCAWTWIEGETRTCLILVDSSGGDATVINEPGPTVTGEDWARLQPAVRREAARADYVALSGSLPPGSPLDAYAELLHALRSAQRSVWVDTSGPSLRVALEVGGLNIKVNTIEAGALLGRQVEGAASALEAAAELRRQSQSHAVVLTLGARGAVMVTGAGRWHAQPPLLQPVSTVGSGDAFLGGLLVALVDGRAEPQALCHGVACGAANALSASGGALTRDDFETVLRSVTVEADDV
jgi:1-phosphofructokinase family hexose kinase